jgi:hypothetical protein
MRYKNKICNTYRRTTKTEDTNSKPGKYCPGGGGGPKWEVEFSSVYLSKKATLVLDKIET